MTDALSRTDSSDPKKHAPNPALRRRESLIALLFISPWLVGFILLKFYPILTALWYSFTDFHMLKPAEAQFIGIANYARVLTDLAAWSNMAGSLGYFLLTVPIELLVALALATIFSSGRLRVKGIFRPLFFMPSIIPAGAIYLVWLGFVDPYTGWLNKLVMEPLGLPPVTMAMGQITPLFLTIMALWSIGPGFLIMLGAMQGIPKELHEAARVDGAGPLMRFISITLPMISPAIFFALVIDLTSAFGGSVLLDRGFVFSQVTNMEGYIYLVMFQQSELGYASALAWVMFTVTMTITIILFRSARRWVYFPEESGYDLFKRKKNLGESTLTIQIWQFTGSAILNLFVFLLLAAYLSPLAYMVVTSIKLPTPTQLRDSDAPLYPAIVLLYTYQGKPHTILQVPTKDGIKEWAIITPYRKYAEFIDPQNPDAGLIHWDGNWRQLKKVYRFEISFEAFASLFKGDRTPTMPQAVANTLWVTLISEAGVLVSSVAVAYGFSRFRIPGGKWLFFLLIATILIPDVVTHVPTYSNNVKLLNWLPSQPFAQFISTTIWPKLLDTMTFLHIPLPTATPWQWLPLIAPHFFASAVYVFLLRQNFKSIPRDLDEAAMIDGAGPLRILFWIIIPQSIPTIATVALLHFFYSWNEMRNVSLYLMSRPDLWPISTQVAATGDYAYTLEGSQAAALLLLIVPVAVLFLFQRFFMNDMVVTGLEK